MAYGKIKDCLKKNILIDDDILLDYIYTRLNEENICDLISYISITNYGDTCYNPFDESLNINTEMMFLEGFDKNIPDLLNIISKKDKKSSKLSNPNYGNIYNIHLINHEINHLIQKRTIIENNDKLKCSLFVLSKNYEFFDDRFFKAFYYNKYHDRFYTEYNANIESYYEIISLLKAYNINKMEKDLIMANKFISKHILYLYSDIDNLHKYSTPIRNSLKLYKHLVEVSKKHDVDIYIDKYIIDIIKKEQPKREIDKLLLGYSINRDTYDYLKNISKGKVKTLNLFDDISC